MPVTRERTAIGALYEPAAVAAPSVRAADAGPAEIQYFRSNGYLAVEDLLDPGQVKSAGDSLFRLLQDPAYQGVQYEQGHAPAPDVPPEGRLDRVRKFWQFSDQDAFLSELAHLPLLLDLVRRIMGEEPELFQDMALVKPPLIGGEKPWHQDCAYFALPPETCIIGAWIALDEATVENGCMMVAPGSHLGGPVPHFQRRDWQICDAQAPAEVTAVPLPAGGCLLFHGLTMHGTAPNSSALRRRALQFHFKPKSAAWTSDAQRLEIFGGEGIGAEC